LGSGEVRVQNQAGGGTTRLEVLGAPGAGQTQFIVRAGGGQAVNLFEWQDAGGNAYGVIDASGFVGIGTGLSPQYALHVKTTPFTAVFEGGTVRIGTVGAGGNTAGPELSIWDDPGATEVVIQAGNAQGTADLLQWQDAGGNVRGRIDASGFVGIQTAPRAPLHVYGGGVLTAVFEEGTVYIGTGGSAAGGQELHVEDALGATQVIIQAGTSQGGTDLLQWQNAGGTVIGRIDNSGFVGIQTAPIAPLHVHGGGAVTAFFEDGTVHIGTGTPSASGQELHVQDAAGSTLMIIQASTTQSTNLLEWQDAGGNVLGVIDEAGQVGIGTGLLGPQRPLHVVGVGGTSPVRLENVPTAAATDEVLRIEPGTGDVTKSTVAALLAPVIVRGSFSVPGGTNTFTIPAAGTIQPGAIVTVTLVGPGGGTIYPLMVTAINPTPANTIVVESSAVIPAGYSIHYIIINP
ncbi:MAG: hypothetical protein NZ960_08555, partial [Candidatus Kapabacteria bacterium]|nr:hypothetical protein [Candidatus Kapabacteria bacterium]